MYVYVQQTDGIPPGVLGLTKMLRVGIASSIEALDPRAASGGETALVLGQIFETPSALFESLRAEDDAGLFFSAAVPSEVRFSDGTLLTAELAARSLRDTPALAGKALIEVRGNRVWFRLTAPDPRFDLTLARHVCAIVLERGSQLHGTGPFMFDHRPNLRLLQLSPSIRLVRNPYYRSVAAIQELRFAVIPPDADGVPRKLLHALRQESIDLTTAVDPSAPSAGLASVVQPGSSTALLLFNTGRRPASSAEVRRGIAAALDRHQLAFACYDRNPGAFAAGNVLPPSLGGGGTPPSPSLDEAKRLLAGVSARLTLLVPRSPRPYLPKPVAVANAIQGQLAHAGIPVAILEARNDDEYTAALDNRTFDLALGGCIAETPADFLEAVRSLGDDPTPLIYGHTTVLHAPHLGNIAIAPDGFLPLADVKL